MHSCRIHTVCCSGRLMGGGGCLPKGVFTLGCSHFSEFGCFAPSRFSHFHCNAMRKAIKAHRNFHTNQQNEYTPGGVSVQTRVCPGGCRPWRRLSAQRGVCVGGVHLPMWTEFLTHACGNITFPQLRLRTVQK